MKTSRPRQPVKGTGVSYRGAIYFQISAAAWLRLNSFVAIFDYDVGAEGRTCAQLWEWR